MPATAQEVAKGLGMGRLTQAQILDPHLNALLGVTYFNQMMKRYNNEEHLALAAYNAGPGTVDRAIRKAGGRRDLESISPFLPPETRKYIPRYRAERSRFDELMRQERRGN
jgi:soluble lytic murein transglycosylase